MSSAATGPSFPARDTKLAPETPMDRRWTMPQFRYESLTSLVNEKFWPAVASFAARYQENPSQTLLLVILGLLAFVPVSIFVAVLFLITTLAATLLLFALQITLIGSSIFLATAIAILSFSTFSAPSISRAAEWLKFAKAFATYHVRFSAPSKGASSSRVHRGQTAQESDFISRHVLPQLAKPEVKLALTAAAVAIPVVFILRHAIESLLLFLSNIMMRFIMRAADNLILLAGLVVYVDYRLGFLPSHQVKSGSPNSARTTSHAESTDLNTSSNGPASTHSTYASQATNFTFWHPNEYRSGIFNNVIRPAWKLIVASVLNSLVQVQEGIRWLIDNMSESARKDRPSREVGTGEPGGEELEGYEVLQTGSGSSAIESDSSLSDMIGKAEGS